MHDLLAVGFPNAHILEAENGEQALFLALSHRPDAVLMDLSMPGIGGLEARRRIKKTMPDIKIISLTIHEDPEYRTSSDRVGANAFILKRKMGYDLIPTISSLLTRRAFNA